MGKVDIQYTSEEWGVAFGVCANIVDEGEGSGVEG